MKASSFDADNIMNEVNRLVHETVSDRYIKHLIDDTGSLVRKLHWRDHVRNIGVRLNFNRDHYKVPPGLYALGRPTKDSEVIVTANYKLTFDTVRSRIKRDCWILVIDTDGINVWCAAGKGRFGTAEIIYWIEKLVLSSRVNHRRLILPQLAGPGVQAHLVKQKTGFTVHYGPVRVEDLDQYLENDYQATEKMRRVSFNVKERLQVLPLECMHVAIQLAIVLILFWLIPFLSSRDWLLLLAGGATGTILFPLLLPIRPFKRFYQSGMLMALPFIILLLYGTRLTLIRSGLALMSLAYAGFLAMNFTGSTTFTSLSGVEQEMKTGLPVTIGLGMIGLIIWIIGCISEVVS